MLSGLRWVTWVVVGNNVAAGLLGLTFLPTVSWWWVLRAGSPWCGPGPDGLAPSVRGSCCARRRPGEYPRGGKIHLRLWLAERLADELGAANLAGAAWMPTYARGSGCQGRARNVDLHSIPPVTGMLTLGSGCSVEPEVDLSGHWLDGDVLHIGPIKVGSRRAGRHPQHPCAGRVVGAAPRSPRGRRWSARSRRGVLVRRPGRVGGSTRGPWSDDRRPATSRAGCAAYAAIAA